MKPRILLSVGRPPVIRKPAFQIPLFRSCRVVRIFES